MQSTLKWRADQSAWITQHEHKMNNTFNGVRSELDAFKAQLEGGEAHMQVGGPATEVLSGMQKQLADAQAALSDLQLKSYAQTVANGNGCMPPPKVPKADETERRTFTVSGLADGKERDEQLAELVQNMVSTRLRHKDKDGSPHVKINIVDVHRLGTPDAAKGPRKIKFTVSNTWEAKALVKCRPQLKGSGIVIRDELTREELRVHNQLWPKFKAARDAQKRAYFERAQLFVDGVEVMP